MGFCGKAAKASEEQLINQYKEELNLIILDEVAERKIEPKKDLMIKSLEEKIEKKEWVNQIDQLNGNEVVTESLEMSTYLLVRSKEGYEFLIEVDNENSTANIIRVTKGMAKSYTITYNSNGGTGEAMEQQTVKEGLSVILKTCMYMREDYTFVGWCENAEGQGNIYSDSTSYEPKKDVTLYAIWEVELVEVGKKVISTKKDNYTDKNGKTATVPAGFAIVPGCSDIAEGLVISDVANDVENTGNQFVWVPVSNMNDFKTVPGYNNLTLQATPQGEGNYIASYKEPYEESGYQKEVEEYNKMKASVTNYKGFYIARYEAGKDDSGNVVVIKASNPYIYVPWGNTMTDVEGTTNTEGKVGAVKLARDFGTNKSYKDVTSTLCYGVQWDSALKFIDPSYTGYAKDSTNQGWYNDNYNSTSTGNIRNQFR